MDPFTEKLLERTRARRENLQKKLSERPAAAGRPVVKRLREPLGETNSVTIQSATDKVPQTSTKPSPSKRKCSGENLQPAADEENQEPAVVHSTAALLSDPCTDKKPPMCPGSSRPSSAYSSLERTSTRAAVQPEPEQMITSTPPAHSREVQEEALQRDREVQQQALQRGREVQEEEPAPSSTGMRSRLQRLAVQRRCWDGDETAEDCPPLSVLTKPAEVPAVVAPPASSGTPVGRRGRLAHLAATIGSWEDDLSHANIPKEKESAPASHKGAVSRTQGATSSSAAHSKFTPKSNQQSSGLGAPASPQKPPASFHPPSSPTQSSSSTSSSITQRTPASLHPPSSSTQSSVSSSNPQKTPAVLSSSASVPQSPLKAQTRPTGPNITCSPQRPELQSKPAPQEKPSAGTPGVKSFLERFEERCQETRTPVGGAPHTRTPTGTPNTRLAQDRLKVAQSANTSSAELTQRQKLERESELALIRNRFQKGDNIWKNNNNERPQNKTSTDRQLGPANRTTEEQSDKPAEREETASEDEPTTQTTSEASTGSGLTCPPVSTSSPLRCVLPSEKDTEEQGEQDEGKETSVDQSINSAVINQLFEGVLDQTEEEEDEEEEEDGLNISSMSLLTPLVETVAAVVKSPEKRLMTSTPANSFLVKSNTPEHGSRSSLAHSSSSDSVEICEGDLRLPYSIDAYRSTRVKETERPNIKQVIVRKEDVSQRGGEPRGASHFNIKQKMKVLTNEMNLQQTVIHQASQALNCCTDEEHGKGSQVEAEAERLLLVATERREALMRELDRLRLKPTAAAPDPTATAASRGSINLTEVRLPLKADFVCSTANRPESTKHSFFILIRADAEHTVASPLASTHRGLSGDTLTFPTKFTLPDASSDFEIDLEVYCLTQKRELCTDKKKKTNKSKMIWRQVYQAHDLCMSAITPKRFLAITKTAQTPVVASPGGPNAVRTSNFVLVGSHKISLSSIGKNKFPLEKIKYEGSERELLSDMFHTQVPFLCPLEGHIFLKLQCDVGSRVEERGFLTMFEDVSGFGAWHRRWCVLSGYFISYWTYPDDEKRKSPIGRINLASCTSRAVEPANREFCARPNTMELITARPQREDDKETLVSQCTDTMCVTKNWLSADTKDERNLWMKKLNQILTDLRMWQPDACYRPQ